MQLLDLIEVGAVGQGPLPGGVVLTAESADAGVRGEPQLLLIYIFNRIQTVGGELRPAGPRPEALERAE